MKGGRKKAASQGLSVIEVKEAIIGLLSGKRKIADLKQNERIAVKKYIGVNKTLDLDQYSNTIKVTKLKSGSSRLTVSSKTPKGKKRVVTPVKQVSTRSLGKLSSGLKGKAVKAKPKKRVVTLPQKKRGGRPKGSKNKAPRKDKGVAKKQAEGDDLSTYPKKNLVALKNMGAYFTHDRRPPGDRSTNEKLGKYIIHDGRIYKAATEAEKQCKSGVYDGILKSKFHWQ